METMSTTGTVTKSALSAVPLHPLLAERWSPRAFDTDHELSSPQLTSLLEAARWAPSAANTQPWRFSVAVRGTAEHAAVMEALAPGNQAWAHAASALVVVAAQTVAADGSPQPWAVYDTGQAVAHLSIQAEHEGLAVHQLGGFDRDRITMLLDEPGLAPQVVIAVGRRGAVEQLPEPFLSREVAHRDRLPVDDIVVPIQSRPLAAAS
jgi:nitroreductase